MSSTETTTEPAKPGLATQATWLLAARSVGFALTLALPMILARVLTREQFGTYRLVMVVANTAGMVLPFGVGTSAFYFLPRLTDLGRKQLITNIVAYHLFVAAILFAVLGSWPGSLTAFVGQDLRSIEMLIAALVATAVFSIFFEQAATANQDVRYSAVFIVSAQASRAVLLPAAAMIFRSVEALLYAWVLQGVAQSAALLWYLKRRFDNFWKHWSPELTAEQIRYVVPLGAAALVGALQTQGHNYFVSHYVTAAEYALYSIATTQLPLIWLMRDSLASVLQAPMSKLQQDNQFDTMLHLMLRGARALALVFIPLFASLMLLAPEFVATLYTPKYLDSVPMLRVNLVTLLSAIFVSDPVVRAFAHVRFWILRVRIGTTLLQAVLLVLLMPRTGMIGAVIALTVTVVIDAAIVCWKVYHLLPFGSKDMHVVRSLGAIAVMSACAAAITWGGMAVFPVAIPVVRLFAGMALFWTAYVAMLAITRFPNEEEIGIVKRPLLNLLRRGLPRLAARIENI